MTLELPWEDNLPNVSCIPTGAYNCRKVISPKFGKTFEVTNVPDRSHILFHKGNIADDTHGCIIVGELFDPLNGESAVLSSGKAFKEFLLRLKNQDTFLLTIFSS